MAYTENCIPEETFPPRAGLIVVRTWEFSYLLYKFRFWVPLNRLPIAPNKLDEVIKIQQNEKVKIYGIKLYRDTSGCFGFSVIYSGQFRLQDYETLEVEAGTVNLTPRFT